MALTLATMASNKVEAFAIMKITAFAGFIPIAAFFLPEPHQYMAGIMPHYWGCKLWWSATQGSPSYWVILPGILVSAAWIAFLMPRLRKAESL